jgi:hypothetical protein
MIRAAMLRADAYEEVEANKSATVQAMAIVVLVSIVTGIGATGLPVAEGQEMAPWSLMRMVNGVLGSLVCWALLALITFVVGAKLLPSPETKANWGELARTLGFAQTAGLLKLGGVIPGIGLLIFLLSFLMIFMASIIAIRQALDYSSTLRAVVVGIISFIPYVLILSLFL